MSRPGPDVLQSITENRYELSGSWMWASVDIYSSDYREILQQPVSLEATNIDLCRFKVSTADLTVRSGPNVTDPVIFACTAYMLDDGEGGSPEILYHSELSGLLGAGPEYAHLSTAQLSGLTSGGDTALHYHGADRARANHTGTQLAATISDFGAAAIAATSGVYQPISAELSALAALSSTGYAKRTGAAAWSVMPSIPQSDVAGLTAALAGLQPLDSDLTAIAALTTTAFGRSLLTMADAAAARTAIGAQAAGSYEAAIAAGTTAQYWRGDKTWQTLNAAAVGLGNVLNVAQEPALGSPGTSGYLLSSTTAGVRSWVAPYSHPATHPQSVVDSASGWITTVLAGKQAAGSYQASSSVLTSIAAQSSGTGLLKLTAGVASLDSTAYLPLSAGSSYPLTGTLHAPALNINTDGAALNFFDSTRIYKAVEGGLRLRSNSENVRPMFEDSAGNAYTIWDAGNLTNLSQLTNGPGYITSAALPLASSTVPSALGTAAVGAGTTWARADHVHAMPTAAQVGAVPTSRQVIAGAGLSGGGALSADVTLSLPSVLTAGSAGGGASVPVLTWDVYGRLAAVGSAAITPAGIGAAPTVHVHDRTQGYGGSNYGRNIDTQVVAGYAEFAAYIIESPTGTTPFSSWTKILEMAHYDGNWTHQLAFDYFADRMAFRRKITSAWLPWMYLWHSGNLVGTRNEHNHTGVYLPLAGGTMAGNINLGGYSITSGSTGLGDGIVSSVGGNFTNLQVVSLVAASGFSRINLSTNLIPSTDSGVNLGQLDKRILAAYSVYSYLSYLDASVEVAGPVMRWKDRIVIGNGGVLPIVGDGCAIVAVGQGTGGVTNKPVTNNYQAVDYRKSDGTLATAAAGGNVIDLDLYGRCAFVVGVSSSRAQLIL